MNPLNKFLASNLGILRAEGAERANKDKLIKDLQRQNDQLAWQEKMRPLTECHGLIETDSSIGDNSQN